MLRFLHCYLFDVDFFACLPWKPWEYASRAQGAEPSLLARSSKSPEVFGFYLYFVFWGICLFDQEWPWSPLKENQGNKEGWQAGRWCWGEPESFWFCSYFASCKWRPCEINVLRFDLDESPLFWGARKANDIFWTTDLFYRNAIYDQNPNWFYLQWRRPSSNDL